MKALRREVEGLKSTVDILSARILILENIIPIKPGKYACSHVGRKKSRGGANLVCVCVGGGVLREDRDVITQLS